MSKKNVAKEFRYLETWNTKNGKSIRIVTRSNGKFVDNVSVTGLMAESSK